MATTTAAIALAARHAGSAPAKEQRDACLANIARITLEMDQLTTRGSDSLDFKELSVWQIKWALEQAFSAGQAAERLNTDRRRIL